MDETTAFLAQHGEDARIIAGGASLVLLLSPRMTSPSVLVSLGRIPGYDSIWRDRDGLLLGPLARLRDVELSPVVSEYSPALAHAFGVVANVRVRNQRTVGGNLGEADFASDPPAMLLALDARVTFASTRGQREISLRDFFLGIFMTALHRMRSLQR